MAVEYLRNPSQNKSFNTFLLSYETEVYLKNANKLTN